MERANLLKTIGFDWEPSQSSWNTMYQRLVAYKHKHNGDTNVPQAYNHDPQLGSWVGKQRLAYKKKTLPAERESLLESIGFAWEFIPEKGNHWHKMYQRLVTYKIDHNGNTKVPRKYSQDPQLGKWVNTQRTAYYKGKMPRERASLLNSIGFDWGWHQSTWNKMFKRLVAYKNNHKGDTNVPRTYHQDSQLGEWVRTQRRTYKDKRMPAERAGLLNSIGFHWEAHSSSWDEMYQRLLLYKANHNGDTNVPPRYYQDSQLGRWVKYQRETYRENKISTEHFNLLNSIGFDWSVIASADTFTTSGTSKTGLNNPPVSDAGLSDIAMTAAEFQAAAARLRDLASSRNLGNYDDNNESKQGETNFADHAANDAHKGCNKNRRALQISRMLCVAHKISSDFSLNILDLEISDNSFMSVAEMGYIEMPSIDIFEKLFHRRLPKSVVQAATPPF